MVGNVHLSRLIDVQAAKYGKRVALMYRDSCAGFWHEVAWSSVAHATRQLAHALLSIGVQPGQKVMIFAENMPECLYVSFGTYMVRAVMIPVFATLNVARLKYIADEAEVSYLFVGSQQQYDTAFALYALCPTLVKLIIIDGGVIRKPIDKTSIYYSDFCDFVTEACYEDELSARISASTPDEIADIIYTSGTTGESKGVIITHEMYITAIGANEKVIPLGDTDIVLDFLPLSHIFERAWAFFALFKGATLALNLHPNRVHRSMYEIRPTAMCVVPHFWEKIRCLVYEEIEKSTPQRRKAIETALQTGYERNIVFANKDKKAPPELEQRYRECEEGILGELRSRLGLERAHILPTAGAAVSIDLEKFVRSCGFGILIGYGLTETTATVACDDFTKPRTSGSVGRIIDGLEIKFGKDNEILLRGKTVTPGYFHRTDSTQNAFDNGWFRTGDAGYMSSGELFITGRIKDLFKTSNGKFVAPQMLEAKLDADRYISQAVIVAEQRKFVSALIVPDFVRIEEYAYAHKISFSSHKELCANEQVLQMMSERLEMLQQELADYEKVKRFVLLSRPFDMNNGEITATLKVSRRIVYEHYADEIEKLYH